MLKNILSESTTGIKSTATQIWQLQAIVPQKKISTAWNFGQFFFRVPVLLLESRE